MKNIIIVLFIVLIGCSFETEKKVNAYFCGGQSNANEIWYETIKSRILEVDETAIVVHARHSGRSISYWVDSNIYDYDLDLIISELQGINYNFKAVFWFQGEADKYIAESYEDNFYCFFGKLGYDLEDSDFKIFIFNEERYRASKGFPFSQARKDLNLILFDKHSFSPAGPPHAPCEFHIYGFSI